MGQVNLMKALLFALTFLAGLSATAQEGRITEAGTGRPVAGAFVFAEWTGQAPNPVDAATICLHAEITTTDEEGRFKLSAWSGNFDPLITDRRRVLGVYKPGYQVAKESRRDELQFVMEPSAGTQAERFARAARPYAAFGCGLSDKDLLPFLKAQVSELGPLAHSKDEQRRLSSKLFLVEKIELGEAEAMRRSADRRRARESSAPEAK
jgi:hypothetical protein